MASQATIRRAPKNYTNAFLYAQPGCHGCTPRPASLLALPFCSCTVHCIFKLPMRHDSNICNARFPSSWGPSTHRHPLSTGVGPVHHPAQSAPPQASVWPFAALPQRTAQQAHPRLASLCRASWIHLTKLLPCWKRAIAAGGGWWRASWWRRRRLGPLEESSSVGVDDRKEATGGGGDDQRAGIGACGQCGGTVDSCCRAVAGAGSIAVVQHKVAVLRPACMREQ